MKRLFGGAAPVVMRGIRFITQEAASVTAHNTSSLHLFVALISSKEDLLVAREHSSSVSSFVPGIRGCGD
jgi:hypothetical protein